MAVGRRVLILGGGFGRGYPALDLDKVLARGLPLELPDLPGVRAIGDCALVPDLRSGGSHPPSAQHALREGRTAARNVAAALLRRTKQPFRFSTLGQLAAPGRQAGVAHVFRINFSGFVAWWLWRTTYLGKLPRLEKRVRVALDWTLDLCFAKDFAGVAGAASGRQVARAACAVG